MAELQNDSIADKPAAPHKPRRVVIDRVFLWRAPGIMMSMLFFAVSIWMPACLAYDAFHVDLHTIASVIPSFERYGINSFAIAVPASALCVSAATYLAYRLRFIAPPKIITPLIALTAPFFSSPLALYQGLTMLFGSNIWTFGIGLFYRYLPIAVIFILISLYAVPTASKVTLSNLRLSDTRLFLRVALPLIYPMIFLIFLFLALVMPLDIMGSTVAGGGALQVLANLIFDYSRAIDFQQVSSMIALFILAMSVLLLVAGIILSTKSNRIGFNRVSAGGVHSQPASAIYLNPLFLCYIIVYVGVLVELWRYGTASLRDVDELLAGLGTSIAIIIPTTAMVTIGAIFIALWLHLSSIRQGSAPATLVIAALLVPPLLPPIIAGRIAAVAQSTLNQYGGWDTISAWYAYFFGALPIFVLVTVPVVFDRALPKIAINHRMSIGDYVTSIVIPTLLSAILVGAGLFFAVTFSDSIIVTYIGGSTETLGRILQEHQNGALSPGDYAFMGGLGMITLIALLACGLIVFLGQRRLWSSANAPPPSRTANPTLDITT
jgi:ABC-type spermidine/putrescine transport system permease subunit II